MKVTLDNFDGSGPRDYTSALAPEPAPRIHRRLNQPSQLVCELVATDAQFVAPANGGGVNNFLHANTYPNSAAPGQSPRECAAGNEDFYANRKVIGNPPENTGTKTDGQVPGQR